MIREVQMDKKCLLRQRSILPMRPFHLRAKTQVDSFKQNCTKQKELLPKRSLRKYRTSQFDLGLIQKNFHKTLLVKKSAAQRSMFGQINLHIPKFRKQNIISEVDVEHPLKQYIKSFKPGSLSRTKKRYKTSCESQVRPSEQLQQGFRLISQSYKSKVTDMEQCSLYHTVDQIYKKIDKFKQVGYPEKKINEWIQTYCLHKRKYMTNLLMKASNKHKFSQTNQDYFYERDPEKVKGKLKVITKKINGRQKLIDEYDLMEFSDYIQEILIQKNKVKIHELKQSISEKLDDCFIYNREKNQYQFGKKLQPPDMFNFISDMNEIQARDGKFQSISSFNRQYFTDLRKTQKEIRQKIYQLITITEKKKQVPPKQSVKRFTFDFQRTTPINETAENGHQNRPSNDLQF